MLFCKALSSHMCLNSLNEIRGEILWEVKLRPGIDAVTHIGNKVVEASKKFLKHDISSFVLQSLPEKFTLEEF